MFELTVVGKGPAAWSCAMTARMRGLDVAVISPKTAVSPLQNVRRIENYPGLPQSSGAEMLSTFREQALSLGVKELSGLVRQVMPMGDSFLLLVENDVLESKAVVLCTGAPKTALLKGEEELLGNGVSICATCDGMFYRGKKIAVLVYAADADEEVAFLSSIVASIDLYKIKGEAKFTCENVNLVQGLPSALERDEGGIAVIVGEQRCVYDGVFIFRDAVAAHRLAEGLDTNAGFITVDRGMRTNITGLFAAGDCTGRPLQIAKAVGEGNIAALSCAEYLSQLGRNV